jgi:hypothetical protein
MMGTGQFPDRQFLRRIMSTITIAISDKLLRQLRERANNIGLTAEEFLSRRVEQPLNQPEAEFRDVAAYVLHKNSELYRRLS